MYIRHYARSGVVGWGSRGILTAVLSILEGLGSILEDLGSILEALGSLLGALGRLLEPWEALGRLLGGS